MRQPLAIEVWHDDEEDRCYLCLSYCMIVACSTTITVSNGGRRCPNDTGSIPCYSNAWHGIIRFVTTFLAQHADELGMGIMLQPDDPSE